MEKKVLATPLQLTEKITLSYTGKGLEHGPMPALFYFALSADESLTMDPYNQPVQALANEPLRIFSLTLPEHTPPRSPREAIHQWAYKLHLGEDIFSPFFAKFDQTLSLLIEKGWILPKRLGVAGLSRGAFIACHVAARCKQIQTVVGFAPLVRLTHSMVKDFPSIKSDPKVHVFDLHNLTSALCDRQVRFYIGNHDERVGTQHAFTFIESLAQKAHSRRIRSSPIELIIGPSIGHKGHGTPKERFYDGARYLKKALL